MGIEGQEKRPRRVRKDIAEYPQCATISLTGNDNCSHFVNWLTEAQKDSINCPKSVHDKWQSQDYLMPTPSPQPLPTYLAVCC